MLYEVITHLPTCLVVQETVVIAVHLKGQVIGMQEQPRITSYNVCYTKLLRTYASLRQQISFYKNPNTITDLLNLVEVVGRKKDSNPLVITSYSIHYTKLYDYTVERVSGFEAYSRVARVKKGELNNPETKWEFFTGDGTWVSDNSKAKRIISGVETGSVQKLGPGNYVMSGVPRLSSEVSYNFV